jgi:hypothetical protein
MWSPRRGSQARPNQARCLAVWATLALGWMLPSTGCQVEYAGMTLPSGKYMHDDVQYFPPGPDFPWANTQAATQRARMQAMGMEVAAPGQGGPLTIAPAQGMEPRVQNQLGQPTDINQAPQAPMPGQGQPPPPVPGPGGAGPGGAMPPAGVGPAVPPPGEATTNP